jgi:hypothetical protein
MRVAGILWLAAPRSCFDSHPYLRQKLNLKSSWPASGTRFDDPAPWGIFGQEPCQSRAVMLPQED